MTLTRYGRVMQPKRPTNGWVIDRAGNRAPIGFVEDPAIPGTFYPRHLDGSFVRLLAGEEVTADVLGPGQMIQLNLYPPVRLPPVRRGWWTRLRTYYGLGR